MTLRRAKWITYNAGLVGELIDNAESDRFSET